LNGKTGFHELFEVWRSLPLPIGDDSLGFG
jgi:hypothetical protein